jgi:hypothetical protein
MQKLSNVAAEGAQKILENIQEISAQFAEDRSERQRRRELVPADFDLLRDAGFLLTVVPVDQGGIWQGVQRSIRPICEMLRSLAHGDSSVALVSAMHPATIFISGWMTIIEAPPPYKEVWEQQRRWVFQMVRDRHQWGVISSEPGSGGDTSKTISMARPGSTQGQYFMTGRKHFGSGSGIVSFMTTTAVPEGETEEGTFILDMRSVPWDGSGGVQLVAEWDGQGMTATQSHAMDFQDFPATRSAWPGARREMRRAVGGPALMFTAVAVGVVENAINTARHQLEGKRESMRAYERSEWARVEIEGWLIQQAYQGMLRSAEGSTSWDCSARLGKAAIAELTESVLVRICKVVGGSTYSRLSPYGYWLDDVRSLGFLRPPWGLAYDQIFEGSWPDPE